MAKARAKTATTTSRRSKAHPSAKAKPRSFSKPKEDGDKPKEDADKPKEDSDSGSSKKSSDDSGASSGSGDSGSKDEGSESKGSNDDSDSPSTIKEKPGGCGCRLEQNRPDGAGSALAALSVLLGLTVVLARRRARSV